MLSPAGSHHAARVGRHGHDARSQGLPSGPSACAGDISLPSRSSPFQPPRHLYQRAGQAHDTSRRPEPEEQAGSQDPCQAPVRHLGVEDGAQAPATQAQAADADRGSHGVTPKPNSHSGSRFVGIQTVDPSRRAFVAS